MPSDHQVLCLDMTGAPGNAGHRHVTRIRTSTEAGTRDWTVVDVVAAVRSGATFSARSSDGNVVRLEPMVCGRCPIVTVTTTAGGVVTDVPACEAAG